ncbi:SGNH/GDSL hydrolase family protein [Tautonia marina]|uniref:SGNH/GDSL hydrolase family protein n=1 Tax=Tautonia marina TaxID=2653855 RepID=UPI00137554D3|nr:SGNH/GDSL hydrolase family protein [Tautonia marina]
MRHLAIALGLLLAAEGFAAPSIRANPPDEPAPTTLELQDGDRIVLLGDALIERMQQFGHFETLLTLAVPEKTISFRNLGWSGDTVFGEARAGFGTPEDGFKTLVEQVKATEPTVLIVGYGANESWDGEAGLPRFRQGYQRLLDALEATGPRAIVLLSPIARRLSTAPTSGDEANLARYTEAIEQIARERGHHFVNLLALTEPMADDDTASDATDWYAPQGLHLSDQGDALLARLLLREVFGLKAPQTDPERFEMLRRAIFDKNQLYFHRYRPQNETYLFGFRKHEQGNNAAEVERFERLVAEAEAEISMLKMPEQPVFDLDRIDEEVYDR